MINKKTYFNYKVRYYIVYNYFEKRKIAVILKSVYENNNS